jgi:hypothetical protein
MYSSRYRYPGGNANIAVAKKPSLAIFLGFFFLVAIHSCWREHSRWCADPSATWDRLLKSARGFSGIPSTPQTYRDATGIGKSALPAYEQRSIEGYELEDRQRVRPG